MSDAARYKSVERWLNNLKPSSSEPHLHYLRRFCDYAHLDPDQIVENAKSDSEVVHDTLKAFRRKLETQGLASNSLQTAYMAVRSFRKWNGVKLGTMPREFKGGVRYESDRVLEPHEVARMISFAPTIRDKAIISFLCHGQRVGVLTALRYGMIREQLEKNVNPIVISVKGELMNERNVNVNKESVPYRFAVVKETADLLRQMIQERRDAGEQIDDETWLFRSYSQKVEDQPGLRRMSRNERGLPLTRSSISEMVQEVAEKAGVQNKRMIGLNVRGQKKVKYDVHSHVFRRFWKRQLKQTGVTDLDLLNFMMGHKMPYGGAYDKFDADYIRKEYSKAEPLLTVMVSPAISEAIELKELEKKHSAVLTSLPEDTWVKYTSKSRRERVQFLKAIPAQIRRETSKSGEKKVMVIDESEAENHLNHGYEFVTVLPSGRLLVRLKK